MSGYRAGGFAGVVFLILWLIFGHTPKAVALLWASVLGGI